MQDIEIGSLVYRKSYDRDVLFRVSNIKLENGKKNIILKGVYVRLEADAEEEDLDIKVDERCIISGNNSDISFRNTLKIGKK